jgi:hypothetical protein
MRREMAEDVATAALGWMATTPEVLGQFLAGSGLAPDAVRGRVRDAAFLAAVLDFVLQDDDWVQAVAAAAEVPPMQVAAARAALPGGDLPHWT